MTPNPGYPGMQGGYAQLPYGGQNMMGGYAAMGNMGPAMGPGHGGPPPTMGNQQYYGMNAQMNYG